MGEEIKGLRKKMMDLEVKVSWLDGRIPATVTIKEDRSNSRLERLEKEVEMLMERQPPILMTNVGIPYDWGNSTTGGVSYFTNSIELTNVFYYDDGINWQNGGVLIPDMMYDTNGVPKRRFYR